MKILTNVVAALLVYFAFAVGPAVAFTAFSTALQIGGAHIAGLPSINLMETLEAQTKKLSSIKIYPSHAAPRPASGMISR